MRDCSVIESTVCVCVCVCVCGHYFLVTSVFGNGNYEKEPCHSMTHRVCIEALENTWSPISLKFLLSFKLLLCVCVCVCVHVCVCGGGGN